MVIDAPNVHRNRFYTYWQPIPQKWIKPEDGMPGETDADAIGCVIILDKTDKTRLMGWHQAPSYIRDIAGWQKPPGPPDNYVDLQKRIR